VVDLPEMLEVQLARLGTYLESDSDAAATVMQMITSVETFLMTWIKENLFSSSGRQCAVSRFRYREFRGVGGRDGISSAGPRALSGAVQEAVLCGQPQ